MAKSLNLCQFIGNIGKDPETSYPASGSAITKFSIACSDDYKDKNTGQMVQQTNWINVVAFGRLAEIVGEYCRKGSKVYVSGKQVTRKWTDQSGADRYSTEIVANDLQMLDGKRDDSPTQAAPQPPQQPDYRGHTGSNQANPTSAPAQPQNFDSFDDDLPF